MKIAHVHDISNPFSDPPEGWVVIGDVYNSRCDYMHTLYAHFTHVEEVRKRYKEKCSICTTYDCFQCKVLTE